MSYTLHLYDAEKSLAETRKPIAVVRVDTFEEAVEVRQWLRGLEAADDRKLSDVARSLYLVTEHVPDVTTALDAKRKILGSDPFFEVATEAKKAAERPHHLKPQDRIR